jgi:P-type Ca2+ transporter type 2C
MSDTLSFDPSMHDQETVLLEFASDAEQGLSSQEAKNRLLQQGPNQIEEEKKHIFKDFFLSQITDPIILILLLAMAIKLITKGHIDAIAIGCVIVFNTLLGLFQTLKAQKALDSLKSLMTRFARVLREGHKLDIPSEDLVLGDIIFLESGMIVPCDARLIETIQFSCDESMLTGESVPSQKNAKDVYTKRSPAQEKLNMVFSGTIVTRGRAKACVTGTGSRTELGKIAASLYKIDDSLSPLQVRLQKFTKTLSISILLLVGFMVGVGFLNGYNLIDLSLMSISLIVSAIPEGLPLAITLCLVLGIQKMAEKKALVKKIPAVETLGSTSVICTDKTGTLTCNQMTVVKFAVMDQVFEVSGSGYEPYGQIHPQGDFSKLAMISALANETTLVKDKNIWVCHGDPSEAALIVLSKKTGVSLTSFKSKTLIPFESEKQYMASLCSNEHESYILIKGAPDRVIHFCSHMIDQKGHLHNIDKELIEKKAHSFSEEALRTLGLAYIKLSSSSELDLKDAVFAGLVGIEDPLRPHMKDIMQECQASGIDIKMITGDHPHTALSIYKKLFGNHHYKVLKGEQIDLLTDQEKLKILPETDIFARVSPQNKLSIIEALKQNGKIVAMTGDGVNDSPSLKGAHIGIAMGTGSDVAKEASSMILLDDNFSTLVKAIEMGRMIFKTLQNLITYLLITAASGVLTVCIAIMMKWPLPLVPIQFLWINLVTDGSSTLPMIFEKLRPSLMKQKPNHMDAPLISKQKMIYLGIMSLYMSLGTLFIFKQCYSHMPLDYARTLAFTTLAFFQIWNVQASRSFEEPNFLSFRSKDRVLERLPFKNNIPLFYMMIVALLLQIGAVIIPFMQPFLKTTNLIVHDWVLTALFTFSILIVSDAIKWINFRKSK